MWIMKFNKAILKLVEMLLWKYISTVTGEIESTILFLQ